MAEARWEAYRENLQKYIDSRDEAALKAAFALADSDANGEVTKEELVGILAAGPNAGQAQDLADRMFALGDADGNGSLDEEEFGAMVLQLSGL